MKTTTKYLLFFPFIFISNIINSQSLSDTIQIQSTLKIVPSLFDSKPDSALNLLKSSLELAKGLNRKKDILMQYKYIAICNAQKGDFATGETICRNAIEYYDTTMNILVLGDLYNNLAIMQMRQLDNKNSINSFQKALEIAKTKNDEKLILKIQFNLSTLYTKIRNYDLSIKTNNDLLNIVTSKEKIDSVFVGNIYRNLGTAYFKKGNLEKCKNYFDLAYKIHKQKNNIDGLTEETGAFGEYYRIKKDYPNSIKWYQTNLEICRQSNNNFGIEKTHISLGKIYIELKDYEKATLYIDSAIFISKIYKNNEDLVHANSLKAKILLEQDSIKQASLVILQNDSIKADNAKKADIQNVQELATKYNVQEKEYKIKENEKVITTTKTKSKTYLLIGILASLSTLVLSFQFYKIHKQNKLIQIQKQEILHNNSNSLRNLKNILINQTSTSSNSLENQQRIEAIDVLNRMLYENGGQTTANINDYLPALCNVKKITTDNKVDIQVTSTNITLGFNQLKDIGQIVNELTMNAIKYAFDGVENPTIKINVFEKDNSIMLNIHDNGKGFNKAMLENENNKGFGLKYVNILVKQNNGTIDIDTEKGTLIAIKIKKIAV